MPWIEGFAKKSNVQERPLLKVAYALGAQAAIQAFQKQARDADLSDPGHLSTALLSPLGLGFVPAAITAKEGKGFRDAAMAGLGGAVGGVGGSAVGGLGGLTVGTLLGALAKRPDIGAAIGGIGGLYGGGVLGAGYGGHKGLSMAREDDWTGPK
ncbi:MAG: hypothetical protein CMK74_00485 [Pseudomonadales bacterium]|nr:hypothetical protein [Pseudomonadales bacterium]